MVLFAYEKETRLFSTFETSFSRDVPALCIKQIASRLSLLRISTVQLIKRNKLRLKHAWRTLEKTESQNRTRLRTTVSLSTRVVFFLSLFVCVVYVCSDIQNTSIHRWRRMRL